MAGGLLIPALALVLSLSNPHVVALRSAGSVGDMLGQPAAVATPAKRVLIYPPLLATYLTIDEGPAHLAAATAYQRADIENGLMRHVYPAAAELPAAATNGHDSAVPGDPERILALEADAILSWSIFSDTLTKIGAPTVQLRLSTRENNRDIDALWRMIGTIAGKEGRVEALLSRHLREHQRVLSSVLRARDRPRALYLYQTEPLLVAFGGTNEDRLLREVGAVNVAAGLRGPTIGPEELLTLAPEIIIIAGNGAGNEIRRLYDDPALRALPAVERRRIYRQPTGGDRMSGVVEGPLMLQWLAEIMHPDIVPRAFRRDLKQAYAAVYGVQLSDAAIDSTLHLDQHAGASGFERFTSLSTSPAESN